METDRSNNNNNNDNSNNDNSNNDNNNNNHHDDNKVVCMLYLFKACFDLGGHYAQSPYSIMNV